MDRYIHMKAITKRAIRRYPKEKKMFKNRPPNRYQPAENSHLLADFRQNSSTLRKKMEERQSFESQYHIREIISMA